MQAQSKMRKYWPNGQHRQTTTLWGLRSMQQNTGTLYHNIQII